MDKSRCIGNIKSQSNKLRASVLGANDGITSIAGLLVGVAGATDSLNIIFTAGVAGIIAGAISMAAGEFVSVSSSRDAEDSLLKKELDELKFFPKQEYKDLVQLYENKGLSKTTSLLVAKELIQKDPNVAHVDAELGIAPKYLTNPWDAAIASSIFYLFGSFIPLTAALVAPASSRIPVVFSAVMVALLIIGTISAKLSKAPPVKAVTRVVAGGALAMAITFCIGRIIGTYTL